MAISKGRPDIDLQDLLDKVSEFDILTFYLGVTKIPSIIKSPLREDNKPSFGLYSSNKRNIKFIDFATKEKGGIFDLLCKMWNCTFAKALKRVYEDLYRHTSTRPINISIPKTIKSTIECKQTNDLQCKIRNWEEHDIKYWESYGINIKWLKYAEVYPISHKIIIKDNIKYVFVADKYAYAYVEHKEGKVTLKIYQPFNTKGYKWSNKHDTSVISLWTKVPKQGDKICICASMKDALCLWANLKIPCIAIQGEGYSISNTAINELKKRYKRVYICLDNDKPGITDARKLSEETGFINVVLPSFNEGKDISDFYKSKGKEKFVKTLGKLFN